MIYNRPACGTLLRGSPRHGGSSRYWPARGKVVVPIEVKSGRRKTAMPGMVAFAREFKIQRPLLVGADGVPLEEFLTTPPGNWLD